VLHAQNGPQTEDDYCNQNAFIPDEIKLEVGGIATLPDAGSLCQQEGEIWIIENAYAKDGSAPHYTNCVRTA
jgi:hypothetical protein